MTQWCRIQTFLLLVVLCISVPCSGETDELCRDALRIRSFADYLYQEGEYYRAIGEYLRLRFLCPEADADGQASFLICRSYYSGARHDAARDCLDRFNDRFPDSDLKEHAFYLRGRSSLFLSDFSDAAAWFDKLSQSNSYSTAVSVQRLWSLLLQRQWKEAREVAATAHVSGLTWGHDFCADIVTESDLPKLNAPLAGILSAIVPGSGHVYCGRYRDAATAFAVNALLIWGLSVAIDHDDRTDIALFGVSELFFYSGTIISAWSSAKKENRRREDSWLDAISRRYPLDTWD